MDNNLPAPTGPVPAAPAPTPDVQAPTADPTQAPITQQDIQQLRSQKLPPNEIYQFAQRTDPAFAAFSKTVEDRLANGGMDKLSPAAKQNWREMVLNKHYYPDADPSTQAAPDALSKAVIQQAAQIKQSNSGLEGGYSEADIAQSNVPGAVGKTMFNLGKGLVDTAKGVAEFPFTNTQGQFSPLTPADNIVEKGKAMAGKGASIAKGAMETVGAAKNGNTFGPNGPTPDEQQFEEFTNGMSQKYGSMQNLLKTLVENPAAVFNDIATVTAPKMSDAEAFMNPVTDAVQKIPGVKTAQNLVGKTADAALNAPGGLIKQQAGLITGAGGGAAEGAMKATPGYFRALRGEQPETAALNEALDNMQSLNESRRSQYLADQAKVGANPVVHPQSGVSDLLGKTMDEFKVLPADHDILDRMQSMTDQEAEQYLRKLTSSPTAEKGGAFQNTTFGSNPTSVKKIADAIGEVNGWLQNSGNTTSLGLDTLRQRLGNINAAEGTPERAFITKLQNGLKQMIVSKDKNYAGMLKNYEDASDFIREVRRELVPTNEYGKANVGTAVRKLTSAMRTRNQGNAYRYQLLRELDKKTGGDLLGSLAGSAFNSYVPRGLSGNILAGAENVSILHTLSTHGIAGITSLLHPVTLGLLALSSPKVMGYLLGGFGLAKNKIAAAVSDLQKVASKSPLLMDAASRVASRAPAPVAEGLAAAASQPSQ